MLLNYIRSLFRTDYTDAKPSVVRSSHWPKVRAAHLEKQPSCQACGTQVSLEVHHITPFHINPSLELDPNNLITLCELSSRNCHLCWGHFYNWKRYNTDVVNDVAWWFKKVSGSRDSKS